MHVFIFLHIVFGLSFIFATNTMAVQSSILYQQTLSWGLDSVNTWGIITFAVAILHLVGLVIRGTLGLNLMQMALFGGVFTWLWASTVYIQDGYYFQFAAGALPNLFFWAWYAWQWRIRHKYPTSTTVKAFV